MFRLTRLTLLVVAAFLCTSKTFAQEQEKTTKLPDNLEGVYDLVSETTALTKPEKSTKTITSENWEGLWQFCNGRYYFVMRREADSTQPYSLDTATGTYRIQDGKLILMPEIANGPFSHLYRFTKKVIEFSLDGDKLTLIEKLEPVFPHTVGEGTVTTVLRRRT